MLCVDFSAKFVSLAQKSDSRTVLATPTFMWPIFCPQIPSRAEEWRMHAPDFDSLSFTGFPLEKAEEYARLYPSMFVLNDLQSQHSLFCRRTVYKLLKDASELWSTNFPYMIGTIR